MTVSIIIPVLNEASTIASTLESVRSLEGDYEVIVVDGGSADGTVAIAGQLAGAATHPFRVLSAPRGRARQMNAGAEQARGEVFLFLHADTVLPKGALQAVHRRLEEPSVGGGRFRLRLDRPGWRYRMIASNINLRDRFFKGFTGDQAIFIRASLFRSLGGYRDITLMEDLDLSKRMCRAGRTVQLPVHVVTSARRWQKNGVFRTIALMWSLRLLYVLGCPPSRLKRMYGDAR